MRNQLNQQFVKTFGSAAIFAALIITILIAHPQRGRAGDDDEQSKIRLGFQINPVKLNLSGKDLDLVGLGSYIVNAQGDCNGCHSRSDEYVSGNNPYFGQHPTKVNPDGFLAGGQDFGTLDPQGQSAHIIPRNLTPDKTGKPEGGNSFQEFLQNIRFGTDLDHWHPTCTGALNAHCVPKPFDGSRLQIMPWPTYGNMTDHELRAIYEYLRAIPCVEGDPGNPTGSDTHGHRCRN